MVPCCVSVISCWVKMDSPRRPSFTSWEGPLSADSLLKHLIIKQQLTDSSLTFSGARQGQGSGSY